MLNALKRLAGDTCANYAIITALLAPVLMMASGVAIDYALALTSSQRLTAAANGAVLAALSEVQARAEVGEEYTRPMIEETMRSFFASASVGIPFTDVSRVSPTVTVDRNNYTASIAFDADYRTSLMKIFGYDTLPISNQAQAIITLRSYININIIVDTSQSMGVGATDRDQQLVAQATGCAFACHINQARGNSSYDRARNNGASMRIDVARNAVMSAMDTLAGAREFDNQITIGLYRFTNTFTEVLSPTHVRASDLAYVKSVAASEIALDMTLGGTNQQEALRQIASRVPANGTGRSPTDRLQYIIVVTDGVENAQAWLPNYWFFHNLATPNNPQRTYASHEVNYALNASVCSSLRDRGVEIFFIYTEYLEPRYGTISSHDRNRLNFITNSLFPIIPERMAACAGKPENVLSASTPAEIHRTFTQLASRLSSPLRLY
ncbi:pilus assembly protein [Pelagibacterium limicola]|uniref:pilus assembly protein n=1 Tax=Pelagibacterium limicola TaxID=2791022 RepID=UPI0018AF78EA|nr:VWA domain-containing protein [Pelagibacterium limicola]